MQIGGLQKFSALDYPGKISCVVFSQGCPLRCRYCHNKALQNFNEHYEITEKELFAFLETRKGLLDAVVFSGGEPLCQEDLISQMFHVKHLGFLIGIHTSGYVPSAFQRTLEIIDWVGFDIKTTFDKYDIITGIKDSGQKALESFNMLKTTSILPFEVRTTYDSRYISEDDLLRVASFLRRNGINRWIIQQCILHFPDGTVQKLPIPSLSFLSDIINVEVRK